MVNSVSQHYKFNTLNSQHYKFFPNENSQIDFAFEIEIFKTYFNNLESRGGLSLVGFIRFDKFWSVVETILCSRSVLKHLSHLGYRLMTEWFLNLQLTSLKQIWIYFANIKQIPILYET